MNIQIGRTTIERGEIESLGPVWQLIEDKASTFDEPAWALAYFTDNVRFLKIATDMPELRKTPVSKLKEIRVFCKTDELHVWSGSSKTMWRLRKDGAGEDAEYTDQGHILWGDKLSADGMAIVESGRGCVVRFPVPVGSWNLPIRMTIRNYIDYDEDGLLRFIDARIVKLSDKGGIING